MVLEILLLVTFGAVWSPELREKAKARTRTDRVASSKLENMDIGTVTQSHCASAAMREEMKQTAEIVTKETKKPETTKTPLPFEDSRSARQFVFLEVFAGKMLACRKKWHESAKSWWK